MRILIVDDYEEIVGGVEIYIKEIVPFLQEEGHFVALYLGKKPANIIIKHIENIFSFRHLLLISRRIDDFKPDVIFAHSLERNISPAVLLAAKQKKVPVVLVIPDVNQYFVNRFSQRSPFYYLEHVKKRFHRYIIKKSVTAYIALSSELERMIQIQLQTGQKVFRLQNPVFWEIARPREKIQSPIRFLFCSRLEKEKGILVLLSALRQLPANVMSQLVFNIVGTGTESERIRKYILKWNLNKNVILWGKVDHRDLQRLYLQSHIVTLPSLVDENAPFVVLEALSQGIPLLTTAKGGIGDYVSDAQIFRVEPTPESIAKMISIIIADPKSILVKSKESILQAHKFTVQAHLKKLEEVFKYATTH